MLKESLRSAVRSGHPGAERPMRDTGTQTAALERHAEVSAAAPAQPGADQSATRVQKVWARLYGLPHTCVIVAIHAVHGLSRACMLCAVTAELCVGQSSAG